MISKTFWHTGSSVLAIEWSGSFLAINILIGVERFRILGGPRGGQIPSRHMTS